MVFLTGKRQRPGEGLRRWELALMLAVAMAGLLGVRLGAEQKELADQMIRLHVVANSDSQADQALKLRVRDAVLEQSAVYTAGLDRQDALEALREALPHLGQIAADTVAREGYRYPVRLTLQEESFPTREYTDFSLPAGTYTALRVELGAGEGHNWWCVIFPPLCNGSVTGAAQTTSLTGDQVSLITEETGGYVVKFKAMELWEEFKQTLAG